MGRSVFFPAFRDSVGLQALSKRRLEVSATKHPVRERRVTEHAIFHPHYCGKLKICSANVCVTIYGETAGTQSG